MNELQTIPFHPLFKKAGDLVRSFREKYTGIFPIVLILCLAAAIFEKLLTDASNHAELRYPIIYIDIILIIFGLFYLKKETIRLSTTSAISTSIFVLLVAISTALSEHFHVSLYRTTEVFISILLYITLLNIYTKDKRLIKLTSHILLASITYAIFNEYINWLTLAHPYDVSWGTSNALENFLHIRPFGEIAGIGIILGSYMVFLGKHKAGFISIFLCSAAVFYSSGRAAIASSLFLIIIPMIIFHKKKWCIPIITGAIASGFIGGMLISPEQSLIDGHRPWPGVWRTISAFERNTGEIINTSGRDYLWGEVIKSIKSSPWFGIGSDSYQFLTPKLFAPAPHNTQLQFALAWGIPAALIATAVLLYFCWRSLIIICRNIKKEPEVEFFFALAYLFIFANGLVDTTFYEPNEMILATVFMAAIASSPRTQNNGQQTSTIAIKIIYIMIIFSAIIINTHAAISVNTVRKMELGISVSKNALDNYMKHPYTGEGYDRWLDRNCEKMGDSCLYYAKWGEKNSSYYSYSCSALISGYYKKTGQTERSLEYLEKALRNYSRMIPREKFRACLQSGWFNQIDICMDKDK
jgi:O-antigen ligase